MIVGLVAACTVAIVGVSTRHSDAPVAVAKSSPATTPLSVQPALPGVEFAWGPSADSTDKTPRRSAVPAGEWQFLAPANTLGGRFEQLAAKDPKAALKEAQFQKSDSDQLEALSAVMRVWVQISPDEALNEIRSWEASSLRTEVLSQAGRMLADSNPEAALALSGEFEPGAQQNDYVNSVVHVWSRKTPDQAAAWAKRLPEGELRHQIQTSIAIEWAQEQPAAAADFIASEMPASPAQDMAALTVAIRWAALEPLEAAKWVAQFPNGPLRGNLLRGVMSHWTARDSNAAQSWVNSLPAGEFQIAAREALAPSVASGSQAGSTPATGTP